MSIYDPIVHLLFYYMVVALISLVILSKAIHSSNISGKIVFALIASLIILSPYLHLIISIYFINTPLPLNHIIFYDREGQHIQL